MRVLCWGFGEATPMVVLTTEAVKANVAARLKPRANESKVDLRRLPSPRRRTSPELARSFNFANRWEPGLDRESLMLLNGPSLGYMKGRRMRIAVFLFVVSLNGVSTAGGNLLSNQGYPNPDIRKLSIERHLIYEPTQEWTYSHHPHLAYFKGRFFAIWSNGRRDEDAPGQRILLSTSEDFTNWSAPKPLVDSLPGKATQELVLTAGGFHQHEGVLVTFFAKYEADDTDTGLLAVTTTDGDTWSDIRALGIPVCPNHGPQRTKSGRLILAGHTSFPYTDDPTGLSGWKMTGIYPKETENYSDDPASIWRVREKTGWPATLCEGSYYQTSDDVLHMLLRSTGEGYRGRLWLTESEDDGENWSPPVETAFTDNNTKFHFGQLPDGRFYYVGCPDPKPGSNRSPLVLSLSKNGYAFDEHFVIADEPFARKAEGRYKGGEYGYPHTLIHDGSLYVIDSRQKEAVEVIRVSLDRIGDTSR